MKNKLSIVFIVAFIAGCQSKQPDKKEHKNILSNKKIEQKQVELQALPEEINKLLKMNESLHASYFNFNQEEINNKMASISSYINEIKNSDLQNKLLIAVKNFKDLDEKSSREVFNEKYHLFNIQLLKVLQEYQPSKTYSRYHCPMVKKDWIQNTVRDDNKTKNPYAPEMKSCGVKKG